MKLIKKMDGAISIFLCLVLTSMIVLSGFLIDGSRTRAGETQTQAAAENSMRSALAGYNRMLKDLYGLFAMSDGSQDSLNEEIEAYMNKTLMTELGISKETLGEQMYGYLSNFLTNSGSREDVTFLNLFDYAIDDLQSDSLYNLAQTEVLEKQIIDYMKYRGPRELSKDFIDRLGMFKNLGKQSGTMKKKVEIDKDFDKIRRDRESLSDLVEYINNFSTAEGGGKIDELYDNYVNCVSKKAYLEIQLEREEGIRDNAKRNMDDLEQQLSITRGQIHELQAQIAEVSKSATAENSNHIEAAISSLENRLSRLNEEQSKLQAEYASCKVLYENSKIKCENFKSLIEENSRKAKESKETIKALTGECLRKCSEVSNLIDRIIVNSKDINGKIKDINEKDLGEETSDYANSLRLDLADKSNLISTVRLNDIKKAINENMELLKSLNTIINSDNDNIRGTQIPAVIGKSRDNVTDADVFSYLSNLLKYNEFVELLKKYNGKCNMISLTYGVKKLSESNSTVSDPRNNFQEIINSVKSKNEISDNLYLKDEASPEEPKDIDLVSKLTVTKKDYSKEDAVYINEVLKGYQKIISQESKNEDIVSLDLGIDQLREILNGADFKNNEESFSSSGLEFLSKLGETLENSLEAMRDSMYINEYALGNFKNALSQNSAHGNQPEKDFSGILKTKRNTHYDGEVEYILCGMKDQQKNIYAVEAQILLMRFALNTLAIYMDSEKVTQALVIAEAIAGITVFGVPIIQTMLLLGWAMAESVADVKLIMDGGKVPVYKVKGDWLLDKTTALKDLAKVTAGQAGSKIIDFGESKVEDLTEAAKEKVDGIIETKVSNAVDKAFAPLEHGVNAAGDTFEDMSKPVLDKVDTIMEEGQSRTSLELQNTITALAWEEFSAAKADIEDKIKNQPADIASNIINTRKSNIKSSIIQRVSGFSEKLRAEINDAAGKGAESLKEYLSTSFGDGSKAGLSMGNTVLSSMTAMGYQDYLKLFLLMRGNNTKLIRIADLIQLNMRLESHNSSFCLENCNTYVRLKATVSMKYLFMTSMFMPNKARFKSGSRHMINLLIYQGY